MLSESEYNLPDFLLRKKLFYLLKHIPRDVKHLDAG